MHALTLLGLITLYPALLCAQATHLQPEDQLPYKIWYTGTYLAETAVNINAIEPFCTFFAVYGNYNPDWKVKRQETTWSINPQLEILLALNKRFGIQLTGGFISSFQGDKKATHLTDISFSPGLQILSDEKGTWVPNFRLGVDILFPTGKYNHLDPEKNGIDATGGGAYFFGPQLAFSKTFRFPCNFMNLYWSFTYLFPTKAHIKELNAFGGGRGTRGKIRPGQGLQTALSAEYSLTDHWVLGLDIEFLHQRASSHFKGKLGESAPGIPAHVGLQSSTSISLAPQIEYNFNSKSGIILGAWCTVAGRNSKAFASAIFAYLYVF